MGRRGRGVKEECVLMFGKRQSLCPAKFVEFSVAMWTANALAHV